MRSLIALALALALATACDGSSDKGEEGALVDSDGDGSPDSDDCAPDDPAVFPGAEELCNDVDDDCDGLADNDPVDGNTYYADADGDGYYGDVQTTRACSLPPGHGFEPTDCDDASTSTYPGADEGCDLVDSDCDGELGPDERDGDGDGFAACEECDDSDGEVNPAAEELCNGVDDDCDGEVDEEGAWYPDADEDGYGDGTAGAVVSSCDAPPEGRVSNAEDCDDADSSISPAAQEVCDDGDVDEDCDGLADDEDDSVSTSGMIRAWPDGDLDGYGDEDSPSSWRCDAGEGWSESDDDCDDSEPRANPGEAEVCGDDIDNDCDGTPRGCGPYGESSTSEYDLRVISYDSWDQFGLALDGAGDVDGDGLQDLVVGARDGELDSTYEEGVVYVFTGLGTGVQKASETYTASIRGGARDHHLGHGVASAGDLDLDGFGDILAVAEDDDDQVTVYLFAGPLSGDLGVDDADATWEGETPLGGSLGPVGDLDGDGVADLAFSSYWVGEDYNGEVYIQHGPLSALGGASARSTVVSGTEQEFLGFDLDGGRDLDGDGVVDLVLSGNSLAAVFLGPITEDVDLSAADVLVSGPRSSTEYRRGLQTVEDADGDGQADLWLKVDDEAQLFLGPLTGDIDLGSTAAHAVIEHLHSSDGRIMAGGDLDADGLSDFTMVCANHQIAGIFLGPVSGTLDITDGDGVISGGYEDVASLGDADGDGTDDLVFGTGEWGTTADVWFGGLGY